MEISERLLQTIDGELATQLKWRRIMSGAYFVTSAVAIMSAGAATVVAGMGYAEMGAVLAGTATVLLGMEKAMLFREKWSHHLSTHARLESLRLEYLHAGLSEAETAKHMGKIVTDYGTNLPVSERREENS